LDRCYCKRKCGFNSPKEFKTFRFKLIGYTSFLSVPFGLDVTVNDGIVLFLQSFFKKIQAIVFLLYNAIFLICLRQYCSVERPLYLAQIAQTPLQKNCGGVWRFHIVFAYLPLQTEKRRQRHEPDSQKIM